MIEQIITAIASIILALVIGYSIGNTDYHTLQRKNCKLELQNKVLEREYDKLYNIINHFKDKRSELLVDDKGIVIYYPLEGDNFFEEIGEWTND